MKNINIIFPVLLVLLTISLVKGQSWTVYNADVEPSAFDPAFSESNGAGMYTYGKVADPADANNNLLSIKTDNDAVGDPGMTQKDNIQLRQYTDEDAVTVVLKARSMDKGNKNLLFDIDFRSKLSARFAIKVLSDGTYDIDKGGDGVVEDKGDWGFDASEWNTFRITKASDVVKIYINEDPTPVFTLTAPAGVDGSGYLRFGDGWGDQDVDTQFDWVIWDFSGAYAPDQTLLPDEFLEKETPLGDWAIYNADVEPSAFDPAFSESNGAGTYVFNSLPDSYIPGNNLLSIKTDLSANNKDNIQLRQYTDEDAVTVVLKARSIDTNNKNLLFDMDFRSKLSARFAIKILSDGTYDIDKGGDGIVEDKGDLGFDATKWNIFRFTKDGANVNIYINEDPTPAFTLPAAGAEDGNGYWRFGDGWSSENVDTQFDWVTWDYSGAYGPGQTRLPDDLIKPPVGDWTIYNADVEPSAFDPAFSESNGAGTYVFNTLPDPDDAGNNLLSIKTDLSANNKDNIQLRQYTDEDAVTVVLKARSIDTNNKNLLFDIDFRSKLSARFAIKVRTDGTYDIDKGGDGIVEDKGDWGFDASEWNIFRFTKNGGEVNVYINEDPTPIFTLPAAGGVDGNGYFRFGDGWSSENEDTRFDWMTWDYSGAYAPDQSRLPDELLGVEEEADDLAHLSDLTVGGETITGFKSDKFEYTVTLDHNETVVPTVTATTVHGTAVATITDATSLPGATTVAIDGAGPAEDTYTITFELAPDTDATLMAIMPNGNTIPNFVSTTTFYEYGVPVGTTVVPTITASTTDPNAMYSVVDAAEIPGISVITVTAEDGSTMAEYKVSIVIAYSDDTSLSDLQLDGTTLSGFSASVYSYAVELDNFEVPGIIALATHEKAIPFVSYPEEVPGTATVTVTAEDGVTQHVYSIEFTTTAVLTGIEEVSKVNLYPNPAVNELFVYSEKYFTHVQIITMNGRLLKEFENSRLGGDLRLDVSDLDRGIYAVLLKSRNTIVSRLKFIK
jgi:hypothetical protein